MLKNTPYIVLLYIPLFASPAEDFVYAAAAGDIMTVKRFVEAAKIPINSTITYSFRENIPGYGITEFTRSGVSALFRAVENNNWPIIVYLLNKNANVDEPVQESSINL